ncbi:MAG: Uma2 family endonuclease [Bacteroidota bacterium]
MTTQINRWKMTTSLYQSMYEHGILTENDQVELINGEILTMSPSGSRHAAVIDRLNRLLNRAFPENAIIRVQSPIHLGDQSMPEPDVVVLRHRADYYVNEHPGANDIYLAIEVSDTSAEYDRTVKLPIYAEAGIPEYWLVDLNASQIEVYHTPNGQKYRHRELIGKEDQLHFRAFDLSLNATDIFIEY